MSEVTTSENNGLNNIGNGIKELYTSAKGYVVEKINTWNTHLDQKYDHAEVYTKKHTFQTIFGRLLLGVAGSSIPLIGGVVESVVDHFRSDKYHRYVEIGKNEGRLAAYNYAVKISLITSTKIATSLFTGPLGYIVARSGVQAGETLHRVVSKKDTVYGRYALAGLIAGVTTDIIFNHFFKTSLFPDLKNNPNIAANILRMGGGWAFRFMVTHFAGGTIVDLINHKQDNERRAALRKAVMEGSSIGLSLSVAGRVVSQRYGEDIGRMFAKGGLDLGQYIVDHLIPHDTAYANGNEDPETSHQVDNLTPNGAKVTIEGTLPSLNVHQDLYIDISHDNPLHEHLTNIVSQIHDFDKNLETQPDLDLSQDQINQINKLHELKETITAALNEQHDSKLTIKEYESILSRIEEMNHLSVEIPGTTNIDPVEIPTLMTGAFRENTLEGSTIENLVLNGKHWNLFGNLAHKFELNGLSVDADKMKSVLTIGVNNYTHGFENHFAQFKLEGITGIFNNHEAELNSLDQEFIRSLSVDEKAYIVFHAANGTNDVINTFAEQRNLNVDDAKQFLYQLSHKIIEGASGVPVQSFESLIEIDIRNMPIIPLIHADGSVQFASSESGSHFDHMFNIQKFLFAQTNTEKPHTSVHLFDELLSDNKPYQTVSIQLIQDFFHQMKLAGVSSHDLESYVLTVIHQSNGEILAHPEQVQEMLLKYSAIVEIVKQLEHQGIHLQPVSIEKILSADNHTITFDTKDGSTITLDINELTPGKTFQASFEDVNNILEEQADELQQPKAVPQPHIESSAVEEVPQVESHPTDIDARMTQEHPDSYIKIDPSNYHATSPHYKVGEGQTIDQSAESNQIQENVMPTEALANSEDSTVETHTSNTNEDATIVENIIKDPNVQVFAQYLHGGTQDSNMVIKVTNSIGLAKQFTFSHETTESIIARLNEKYPGLKFNDQANIQIPISLNGTTYTLDMMIGPDPARGYSVFEVHFANHTPVDMPQPIVENAATVPEVPSTVIHSGDHYTAEFRDEGGVRVLDHVLYDNKHVSIELVQSEEVLDQGAVIGNAHVVYVFKNDHTLSLIKILETTNGVTKIETLEDIAVVQATTTSIDHIKVPAIAMFMPVEHLETASIEIFDASDHLKGFMFHSGDTQVFLRLDQLPNQSNPFVFVGDDPSHPTGLIRLSKDGENIHPEFNRLNIASPQATASGIETFEDLSSTLHLVRITAGSGEKFFMLLDKNEYPYATGVLQTTDGKTFNVVHLPNENNIVLANTKESTIVNIIANDLNQKNQLGHLAHITTQVGKVSLFNQNLSMEDVPDQWIGVMGENNKFVDYFRPIWMAGDKQGEQYGYFVYNNHPHFIKINVENKEIDPTYIGSRDFEYDRMMWIFFEMIKKDFPETSMTALMQIKGYLGEIVWPTNIKWPFNNEQTLFGSIGLGIFGIFHTGLSLFFKQPKRRIPRA